MQPGRRSILTAAAAALAATTARGDPLTGPARAAQWLASWDGQGTHRCATPGDEAGAAWLAAEVQRIGPRSEFEEFGLDRVDPLRGFVEFDGQSISGLQMFDAPDTPPGGVEGLVAGPDSEARVALTELSPLTVYTPEFARMRRETRARAIVAVTRGGAPGLALLNAEAFRAPYGPPILQVPSEAGEMLASALGRGAAFRMVTESRRVSARARNLVLTLPGSDPTLAKLVVMTPRSSWWQSTSERGGGLVCWLEALRALAGQPRARDVIFTANSGHELGHIGLDDFLARRLGWETAATWVHFGANIGAAGGQLTAVSQNDDLRALADHALARADIAGARLAPKETMPNGETRDIHRAGGRYLTLVGSNNLFHLPHDRYPDAVDTGAVARIAAVFAGVVATLAR